jgi:hypothetical protein
MPLRDNSTANSPVRWKRSVSWGFCSELPELLLCFLLCTEGKKNSPDIAVRALHVMMSIASADLDVSVINGKHRRDTRKVLQLGCCPLDELVRTHCQPEVARPVAERVTGNIWVVGGEPF